MLGKPTLIRDGMAEVELEASSRMAVDDWGLIHGGFTFGLADYAAMLAVNHPYVVLGSAQIRFLAPVKVSDVMKARAVVLKKEERRIEVEVEVTVKDTKVLTGIMTCYILDGPILAKFPEI